MFPRSSLDELNDEDSLAAIELAKDMVETYRPGTTAADMVAFANQKTSNPNILSTAIGLVATLLKDILDDIVEFL